MAARADVKELTLRVDAATELAQRNLRDLEREVSRSSGSMNTSLATIDAANTKLSKSFDMIKNAAGGFIAAIGVGTIVNAGRSMLQFADDLGTAADQAGISVEKYQTLKEALRTLEIGAGDADKVITAFQTTLGDVQSGVSNSATKAIDKLGLSAKIMSGEISTSDQLLEAFAGASGKAGTEAQYMALAVDVLGKKLGVDFAAATNDSGAALTDLQQKMIDSGLVIDSALIAKLADANEAIDKFKDDAGRSLIIFSGDVIDTFQALQGAFDPATDGWLGSLVNFSNKGRGIIGSFARDIANFLKQYDDVINAGYTMTEKIDDLAEIATFGGMKARRFERQDYSGRFLRGYTTDRIMSGDPFADFPKMRGKGAGGGAKAPIARSGGAGRSGGARRASGGGSRAVGGRGRAARAAKPEASMADLRDAANADAFDPITTLDTGALANLDAISPDILRLMKDEAQDLSDILESMGVPNLKQELTEADRLFLSFKSDLAAGLADAIVYGEDLGDVLENTFKRAAAALIESGIMNFLTGGKEGTSFADTFGNIMRSFGGGRASGGPVDPSKFYMVGEKGPELFQPKVPGSIIPNHAMRGSGGGTTLQLTINAPGATAETVMMMRRVVADAAPAIAQAGANLAIRSATRARL